MTALKASWEVRAGIIPGQAMPEFTKQWHYTSADGAKDEEDGKARHARSQSEGLAYHSLFAKMRSEATDYHLQVSNPQMLNWAELTFIWY